MITDCLENWSRYFSQAPWRVTFDYLSQLDPAIAEGDYELQGKDIYARVMSYDTVTEDKAILEAHHKYIDIQLSLIEDERIDWFPLEGLQEKTPYNPEKDSTHYHRPGPAPAQVMVRPGMFVVLLPTDAHMPKLITTVPHLMKKAVVKLKVALVASATLQESIE